MGNLSTFVALAATFVVLCLYGPGVRRPFGSLRTVDGLPESFRNFDFVVRLFDWLFVLFMIAIVVSAYQKVGFWYLFAFASIFAFFGDFPASRVRIVPSFWIATIAAIVAAYFMWFGEIIVIVG
ncbi:MAG: hypothetical protein K9G60_01875 [Pseudolabrys sp.]|nr:hypothetical protein [Pseudolabrys sp.]